MIESPDGVTARTSDADRPAALAPDIVRTTREYLERHLAPLRDAAARGQGGFEHARRVAAVYDGLLSAYFLGAAAKLRCEGAGLERVALLAVGGYGRATLGLGSDLDLIVLAPDVDDPRVQRLAETFLYPLWDAGVSIGHSVRSPDELVHLGREDLRTTTTILDARAVAGDDAFARQTLSNAWSSVFDGHVNAFLDALLGEMSARHGRYGASVYLLEPNVKLGRGTLRDLDIARWALAARYKVTDFHEALQCGAIGAHDAATLEDARDFFWRARGVLHARTGRRSDRLTYDEQEACAHAFGLVPTDAHDEVAALAAGSERFMQRYYRHARSVATTLDRLLDGCRVPVGRAPDRAPRADRVADGIERFDGALTFSDHHAVRTEPMLALRIVDVALKSALPLAARAREVIAECARDEEWGARLRATPGAGSKFLRLLAHTATSALRVRGVPVSVAEPDVPSVLAELHDLGLLLALVPEFHPVTGRVHHDTYHVYTVDVHSVASVDRLHQIARGELSDSYALATRVLADIERRHVVTLATLLHDVGKGRGGDHSRIGAELVVTIAERMGLSADEAADAAWLVREHLFLYHLATRRDLGDPTTVAHLADRMRDAWRLRALYLLTVADLSTTSPTSMTSWKSRMLDEVLRRGEEALTTEHRPDALGEVRQRVVTAAGEVATADVVRFIERLPPRYLTGTPPESVARHARALEHREKGRPLVQIAPIDGSLAGELVEVVVLAPDRPGLLARLAGMLFRLRLDVQSAQLFPYREADCDAWAFDVFTVRRMDDDPGGLARLALRLPKDLTVALSVDDLPDRLDAEDSRSPGRRAPAIRSEVVVDNAVSDRYTVIEVYGRDRPGMLYAIAAALFRLGLTIAIAKVNTEGHRLADVFYVTETDGSKVVGARFDTIRERLRAALGE